MCKCSHLILPESTRKPKVLLYFQVVLNGITGPKVILSYLVPIKKSLLRWRSWVLASFYYFRWHLQKYLYSINYSNMSRLRFSFIFMSVWKVLFVEKLKFLEPETGCKTVESLYSLRFLSVPLLNHIRIKNVW